MSRWKNLASFLVATGIFVGLIWFSGPEDVYESFKNANIYFIGVSVFFGFLTLCLWSLNWHNFLNHLDIDTGFLRSFQLYATGQFLNSVTPLGRFGGQPLMAYVISKNRDSSYEKSLATVLSADTITLAPLLAVLLTGYTHFLINEGSADSIHSSVLTLASLLILGLSIGYVGWFKPGNLEKGVFRLFNIFTNLTGFGKSQINTLKNRLKNSEDALGSIGDHKKVLVIGFIITLGALLTKSFTFYFVFLALGTSINLFHAFLVVPLISIANVSPTPGGSGTFEAAMIATTGVVMSVDPSTGLAAAVLYRLSIYWLNVVVGYIASTTIHYDVSREKIEEVRKQG